MAKKKKRSVVNRDKAKKAQQNEQRKLGSGGSSTVRPPDGVEFYRPEEGKSRFALLPHTVGDSRALAANMEPGEGYYKAGFKIHRNVGPEDTRVTCLTSFGKKCFLCQEMSRLQSEEGKSYDEVSGMRPSRREIFLVAHKGELKVLDMSYHQFGKLLELRLEDVEEDEGMPYEPGDDLDLLVNWENEGYGPEALTIDFKKRKTELEDEVIEQAMEIDLGSLVIETPFDEMETLYFGGVDDDDDDVDEDDVDEDDDEEEEEKPKKKSKSKSKKEEPEEEDEDEEEEDEEEEDDEEEEEDEDEEEEDEDEDEEEEQEEKPKKKSKSKSKSKKDKGKKDKCPHGHKFGVDCDEYPECDTCKLWDACEEAMNKK